MIIPQEYKIIKEVLGYQYAPKIKAHFDKVGIKNTLGLDYSTTSIRLIVTSQRENIPLEIEILRFVKNTNRKNQALQTKRSNLFK
jgi:hypothetical protein